MNFVDKDNNGDAATSNVRRASAQLPLGDSVITRTLMKVLIGISPPIIILVTLIATKAKQMTFILTGGSIGFVCSAYVLKESYRKQSSVGSYRILFWRAFCDVGLAARFLCTPLINYYSCGDVHCYRDDMINRLGLCNFPSFWFEFFAIGSEFWFLCNGLDLYASITNPFSSVDSRMITYHTITWGSCLLLSVGPLFARHHEIYGLWFVNKLTDNEAFCWITTATSNARWTLPIWFFFFIPLFVIYLICVCSLLIAFKRLRGGVTRTFLPRMKLLVTNTVNVVCLIVYWIVLLAFYFSTWIVEKDEDLANALFHTLIFVVSSKGFSALFVWLIMTDHSSDNVTGVDGGLDTVDLVDANKSLREEVLNFATAGIRSSARAGISASPDRNEVSRRPQRAAVLEKQQMSLLNFVRFILGSPEAVKEVNRMIGGNRRSVLPNFGRQTETGKPLRDSDFGGYDADGGMNYDPDDEERGTHNSMHLRPTDMTARGTETFRLSQRPTIVTSSTSPSPGEKQLAYNTAQNRGSANSKITGTRSSQGSKKTVDSLHSLDSEQVNVDSELETGSRKYTSEQSNRPSEMVETGGYGQNIPTDGDSCIEYTNQKSTFLQRLRRRIRAPFDDSNSDVEFTEFEPYHFRRIRYSVGITDEIYINCFSTTIKERLTQGGASGSFFFYSKGEQFIAKSCTAQEIETIKGNAAKYADYLEKHPASFITKIFGAYRLRIYSNSLYFFVMNNLFLNPEKLSMNEKYDLKGSWVSRNAEPPSEGQTVTCTHCEQKYTYTKKKKKFRGGKHGLEMYGSKRTISTASDPKNPILSNDGHPQLELLSTSQNDSSYPRSGSSAAQGRENSTPSLSIDRSDIGTAPRYNVFGAEACPYTVDGLHEPNLILKDNDLKYKIRLPAQTAVAILNQMRMDADYLLSCGIMDYSLLVGVHNTEYEVLTDGSNSGNLSVIKVGSPIPSSNESSANGRGVKREFIPLSSVANPDLADSSGRVSVCTGLNSMSIKGSEDVFRASALSITSAAGGIVGGQDGNNRDSMRDVTNTSSMYQDTTDASMASARKLEVFRVVGPDAYFMGIIDFQQKWTLKKRLERFYKTTFRGADPLGLSAIEPEMYRDRFLKKVEDILDFDDFNRATSHMGSER